MSLTDESTAERQGLIGRAHATVLRLRGLAFRRRARSGPKRSPDDITVVDQPMLKRAIAAASLGNCMEWFDFGVYGYLAGTIGKVFFPGASPAAQLISTFATFAAAFLIRPIGGLFFGPLGDRIGRQKVLAATMIMMAIGTFAVGCIPGYATIGVLAPILLLAARLVQGFSTGGEYGGATTFIAEYSPDRRRGFLGGFLDFGTFIGYAIGSGLVTVLNATLGPDAMLDWGWRIPFWVAGPLGVVGLYLRLKLEDTPAFRKQLDVSDAKVKERETGRRELRRLFTKYWRPMLVCAGLVLLYNVTNYMVTGFLPTFLTDTLGRAQVFGDLMVLASILTVVALILLFGRISDYVGRRPVFLVGAVGQIVLAYPCFLLITSSGTWRPLIGCIVLGVLLACFAAPSASTLPALFPTAVRYAGLAIAFNLSVSLFGGTTPLATNALIKLTGSDFVPAFYLIVSGIIGLVSVYFLRESATQPLWGSPPMVADEPEADRLVQYVEGLRETGLSDTRG